MMARPQDTSENTLHGFAVENDVKGIEDLLAIDPNMDLNLLDEHVSKIPPLLLKVSHMV
jgi:hypothetical protein